MPESKDLPLFTTYPRLIDAIPYTPIALLPTTARRMDTLSASLGCDLWLKDDGATGTLYGGNKVRKLGFLLASAKKDGARTVLTFGAAGSNHALTTAIYAREMGLRAVSMLVPQPGAHSVRRNLLRHFAARAELHYHAGLRQVALATCWQFTAISAREGRFPRVIATGGSSPTGILGFVNAALELKQQIDAGQLPTPDSIYVASGTMGTAVGLALGLQLAGLPTRVVAVRVTTGKFTNIERGRSLYESTNRLLHQADPAIPLLPFPEAHFEMRDEFLGQQYALYTPASAEAMRRMRDAEGLKLEGTYTGKALACMLSDAAAGRLHGKQSLFWNTYNSVDFSGVTAGLDYHQLPPELHHYFEEPVQPLDTTPDA
jgi:1-aminocyclopropane-1-carboxylate deaminase/D-cysteine desulfhydrase-like pyridoxal-dependent ACC family enzyme